MSWLGTAPMAVGANKQQEHAAQLVGLDGFELV